MKKHYAIHLSANGYRQAKLVEVPTKLRDNKQVIDFEEAKKLIHVDVAQTTALYISPRNNQTVPGVEVLVDENGIFNDNGTSFNNGRVTIRGEALVVANDGDGNWVGLNYHQASQVKHFLEVRNRDFGVILGHSDVELKSLNLAKLRTNEIKKEEDWTKWAARNAIVQQAKPKVQLYDAVTDEPIKNMDHEDGER